MSASSSDVLHLQQLAEALFEDDFELTDSDIFSVVPQKYPFPTLCLS